MANIIDNSRFDIEKIGEVFGSLLLAPSVLQELQFNKNKSTLKFNFEYQGRIYAGITKTRVEEKSNYLNLVIKLPNSTCFHNSTKQWQEEQTRNFHKLAPFKSTNQNPDVLEKIWNFAERLFGENNLIIDEYYSSTKKRIDIKIKHKNELKMITITFKKFKLKNIEIEEDKIEKVGV